MLGPRGLRIPLARVSHASQWLALFAWLFAASVATASLDMPLRAPSPRHDRAAPVPVPAVQGLPRTLEPPSHPKMQEIAPWEQVPT